MKRRIACITGATGLIGKRIMLELKKHNIKVRILSRRNPVVDSNIQVFKGGLENLKLLNKFLSEADYLFHCAGEKKNLEKMQSTNVDCTRNIINAASVNKIKYFCHISSAGVIGKTDQKLITEETARNPQNEYERTKYEAERIAQAPISNCSTIILRPINVIAEEQPGAFSLPIRNSLKDRLTILLKGAENAHVVHAQQIAECAVSFMNREFTSPEIFFIGNDEDSSNTFEGIWNCYCNQMGNRKQKIKFSLPIMVPYWLRKIKGINTNKGDVKYSSQKLHKLGFDGSWNVNKITKMIAKENH